MENLPLPDEIVLKILGYLSLGELIQCARVSKRLSSICNDHSLSYSLSMLEMKDLTVKDRKSIIDILIARPTVRKVTISRVGKPLAYLGAQDLIPGEVTYLYRIYEKEVGVLHVMIWNKNCY